MKAMFCSNCGNKLEDNANFCPQCGAKVASNALSTPSDSSSTLAEPSDTVGTFTDPRDGRVYKTVKIGNQVWMAENLAYDAPGSVCYENDPANFEKYGLLYKWETAMKVCPPGWHLPSRAEWDVLITYAGGRGSAGIKLKATSGWNSNGNGTDDFAFSALPGGIGDSHGGFYNVGTTGYWWSATADDAADYAYYRIMNYISEIVYRFYFGKSYSLLSVRCIKDDGNITNKTEDDPNDLSWLDEPVPPKTEEPVNIFYSKDYQLRHLVEEDKRHIDIKKVIGWILLGVVCVLIGWYWVYVKWILLGVVVIFLLLAFIS